MVAGGARLVTKVCEFVEPSESMAHSLGTVALGHEILSLASAKIIQFETDMLRF